MFMLRSLYWKVVLAFSGVLLVVIIVQGVLLISTLRKTGKEIRTELETDVARFIREDIDFYRLLSPDSTRSLDSYLKDRYGHFSTLYVALYDRHLRRLAANSSENTDPHFEARDDRRPMVFGVILESPLEGDSVHYVFVRGAPRSDKIVNTGVNIVIQILVAIFGASVVSGFLILWLFVSRVKRVSRTVMQIADGDLSQRVVVNSHDEIGQLGVAVNQMANRISIMIEQLKETDARRRELVANVSHELNTPLTSIRGYVETLTMRDHPLTEEEREKYLNIVNAEVLRLNRLIEDLTELSKLDAKEIALMKSPTEVETLVRRVVSKYELQAQQQHIALSVQSAVDALQIEIDEMRIEQVLANLIVNALRYTPAGGSVSVSVSETPTKVAIVVSDTGQGIPQEDIHHIFERFYRVDKSRSRDGGGTGLGLAIAKHLVELHSGTIEVDSQVGKGTMMVVKLPKMGGINS
jgi:signal transduction histidine kinase